jgi:hypothetical protein
MTTGPASTPPAAPGVRADGTERTATSLGDWTGVPHLRRTEPQPRKEVDSVIIDEIPADTLEKACAVVRMSETIGIEYVTEMLGAWIAKDPAGTAHVMIALARLADEDKYLKQAHAAYTRGDRNKAVIDLERRYQRLRKAKTRYHQQMRAVELDEEAIA